jgi:hypothetical protein
MFRWLERWVKPVQPQAEAAPPPMASVPILSAEEELAQSLARFRSELRATETRLYKEARAEIREDELRIERAREFVRKAGLDSALTKIAQRVQYWPSWLSRSDATGHVCAEQLGMSNVTGEEVKSDKGQLTRVRFEFQARSWGVEFEQGKSSFDGRKYGKIRFWEGSDEVVCVRVVNNLEKEFSEWQFVSVEVLKPGDWAGIALQLEHAIRVDEEADRLARQAKHIRSTAEGLPKLGA